MISIMPQTFFHHLSKVQHTTRVLERDELLFERDDPVNAYYAVMSGEVHLLRRQEDGSRVILQRAFGGAVLAEASLMTQTYHCAAVGVEVAKLMVFDRREVRRLAETNPNVALSFTHHLTAEVQRARRRAEILALRKVSDRLAAWLVWQDGQLPDKGQWHRVASEIGVSPEALYRELAKRR